MNISVVLPDYNEINTADECLRRALLSSHVHHIVVVDDGSQDGTAEAVLEWEGADARVQTVHHFKNEGKGSAIRTGMRFAMGEIVLVQDADLEYNSEDYMLLIDSFEAKQASVVYGSRFTNPEVVRRNPKWHTWGNRLHMPSAISAKGGLSFMVCSGTVASPRFCEFIDRLMHGRRGKVFLVLDGHSMHKSKLVNEHVARFKGRLELFFLPPYSPELNPDELVWNHVKTHTVGKMVSRSLDEMRHHVENFLTRLQSLPKLVCSFFMAPETRYAL